MPYAIRLPDGTLVENIPDEVTPEAAKAKIIGAYPNLAPKPSKERTWGEAAKDVGAGVMSGVGGLTQLPGQLYGLATGNFEKTGALGLGEDIQKYGEEMKSPGLKAREAERARKIQEAEKEGQLSAAGTAFMETVKDPALLTSFLAEQAPQLAVPLGAAKVGRAASFLRSAGKGVAAEEAAAAAGKAGASAAVGAGAVQQGADIGAGSYENLYKELIAKDIPPEKAAETALKVARATGASGAIISLLAQRLPGARTLEETLAGVPGKGGRAIGAIKGGVGEGASEVFEETGGKFSQNLGQREVNPEQSLTEGLGQTAGMAAIGGVGMGGVTGALQRPAQEAPETEKPPKGQPTQTVMPPVNPAPPPTANVSITPEDLEALKNYTQGLPDDASDVFQRMQNRDRSTPASIQQMQGIAQNPDYDRLKTSADFGSGAPVVISDKLLSPAQFGRVDTVTASDGRKIPVQYAVVDAGDLLASHTADGRTNDEYGDINQPAVRAVAGNGRIAGLQAAYNNDTAENYRSGLEADNQHGVSADVIQGMENPVLVRIMPKSFITSDIGDVSNVGGQLRLSPVEAAKNDGNRIDLNGLQFNDDGGINTNSLIQFVRSMPKEEQGELMDANGMPTRQAVDRLNNAIFYKAYGSDTLIDLYAQAQDQEARLILQALARSASKAAQLDGANEYDIRKNIVEAAELAVNARRNGIALKDYVKQADIGMDPYTQAILEMFAENGRSGKRMGELLGTLADTAANQANAGEDMFGTVPKLSLDEVFKVLKEKPTEPDLFAPEPKTEPKKPAPPKPVNKTFVSEKSTVQIEQEVKGLDMRGLTQWAIDNAPNPVAKYIATMISNRINAMMDAGVPMSFKVLSGAGNKGAYGSVAYIPHGRTGRLHLDLELNGNDGKDKYGKPLIGTNYRTILHELLHAATTPQTITTGKHAKKYGTQESKFHKELSVLLTKIRNAARKELAGPNPHPFLKEHEYEILHAPANQKRVTKNVDELIAYSMTEADYQDWLKTVDLGKGQTAFSKLVDLFRQLLGIDPKYKSALEELASVIEAGLTVPVSEIKSDFTGTLVKYGKNAPKLEGQEIGWTQKRIDRLIGEFGYTDGRTFAFAANINPSDFVNATTPTKEASESLRKEAGKLDLAALSEQTQTPFLYWDIEKNAIVDHEGRHRMAAMADAGYKSVPVVLVVRDRYGSKKPDKYEPRDSERLSGQSYQDGKGQSVKVTELTPISYEFADQLSEEFGNKSVSYSAAGDSLKKVEASAKEFLQKRKPFNPESFEGVDPDFIDKANPIFRPQKKTIIDRIEGMRDGFWRKLAQGVADQYRTIKDYSEEAYMLARMSKSIDGALEGLMFNGEVIDDGGALNIKHGTKGLVKVLQPLGNEVDRYQMWVALNRESQLPANKRSRIDNLEELVARRDELVDGDLNGKPRKQLYESVRKDMNRLNKSVLKIALDKGLIDSTANAIQRLNDRIDETLNDPDLSQSKQQSTVEDLKAQIEELRRNPIGYERFVADINYIPFYREMEDGDISKVMTSSGLSNQHFSKALEGGESPFADLMENTLRNWSHILSASQKNQASKSTLDAAVKLGGAEPNLKKQFALIDGAVHIIKRTKDEDGIVHETSEIYGDGLVQPWMTTNTSGAVKVMIDGQPAYYNVLDPMLLESITSIGYMGPKSKFLDVARDFKNILQFGVTLSPAFKVRNLFRDSISAMAISDLSKNPFANVARGWAETDKNNPAHISALAGGAIFNFGSIIEGDQAKLVKRLVEMGVPEEHIIIDKNQIKNVLKTTWDKYQEWGNKSEAANRMALYSQLRDKGMSHLEASFYARDLLDFSMQGAWPAFRLLTQVIPFLNARVQGLYKLGKDGIMPTSRVFYNTITGKPIKQTDKQKAESFSIVTTAVCFASLALYFAFKDDEEFKKRDEWDRDNFWWFKLPNMDYAIRIPKPFEVGAFGTMAERVAEQIFDQGSEGKQFEESLKRMLGDTFALNPTPQAFKPLLDLYANKDSFSGSPIESAGMERLSKQERVADTTSPLAVALGGISEILPKSMELSPVQADYAIKAYFGWLGGTVAEASHYAVMPFKDGAYPDTKWVDRASIGFVKSLPSNQSKYVTSFYENNKEISQAFADMRHYAAIGQMDKVQQIMEEKGDKVALNKLYDKSSKQMAKIRQQISVVMNDPTMSGAEKRDEIDRMKGLISMLAEQSEEIRKSSKQ
jgi:hypothetical protein